MNASCTQTNLVLDGLFTLLACGKCKETPEKPVRFITCGHFFCERCVENDSVCRQCNMPVKPNEKRPHYIVAQMVNYCKTVKEMISDLDVGDLLPLANAIHQFTTEHSQSLGETALQSNTVAETPTSNDEAANSNSEPETAGFINAAEKDQKSKENDELENASFVESSQACDKPEKYDRQLENARFTNSLQACQRNKENNQDRENTSYVDSSQICQKHTETDGELRNASFVDSSQISQRQEDNLLQDENLSFVNSSQPSQRPGRIELRPGNVSFVHSTQIIRRRNEGDVEFETPGYIDPTQFSPIPKEVDSDSETPGYRDPTQAIQHDKQSNFDSETPGYREATQISLKQKVQYSGNKLTVHGDPTYTKDTTNEPHNISNVDPTSPTKWSEDMELEIEEKDLFSPVPDSTEDLSPPQSPEMEVSFNEADIIPETLEEEINTQAIHDEPPNSPVRNIGIEPDELINTIPIKQVGPTKTLQRKMLPMNNYENVGTAEKSVGKSTTRILRRLTDSDLERCNREPIESFDSLSVPDMRESFMEDQDENKVPSVRQIRRIRSWGLNKPENRILSDDMSDSFKETEDLKKESMKLYSRGFTGDRRSSIAIEDRDPIVAATMIPGIDKEAPPRQLKRIFNLRLNRRNETPVDTRDTLNFDKDRYFPTETKDLFESERIQQFERENTSAGHKSIISMDDADTESISNIRDIDMETGETIDKTQPRLLGRTEDTVFARVTERVTNNADAVSIANMHNSTMKSVATNKKAPVKRLRRLTDWEIERIKKTSNNPDTMETPFSQGNCETEKQASAKPLRRIRDFKLDRSNKTRIDEPEVRATTNVEDSTAKNEKITDNRTSNKFDRITNLAMARLNKDSMSDNDTLDFAHGGHLAETSDFETEYIPRLNKNNSSMNERSRNPMADRATTSDINVQDSSMDFVETATRPRELMRLTNWPLNQPGSDSINDSDTVNVANVGDLETEFEKMPEIKPLRRLRRLEKPEPGNGTIKPNDLHELDITNIQDFVKEKPQRQLPMDDSDTVDVADIGETVTESERIPERPLRQIRNLYRANPGNRTVMPNDIRDIDITNMNDFGNEKPQRRGSLDDSDTVDVANISETLVQSEINPLRPLRNLQNTNLGNRTVMPNDIRDIDITNINDFGNEKLENKASLDDSDTVDIANIEGTVTETERIPEIRPLRQLRRLQNTNARNQATITSDVRGVNLMNLENLAKERAVLVEKTPVRRGTLGIKRPSTSPPNDDHPLPVANTGSSAQAPLKQLRSVENIETETQNSIPAKKAKSKVVHLKPPRRGLNTSAKAPKTVPKNVNKRNVKGETILHTACVKGQDDYVRALLEAGANPNTKDNANWTPLQEAIKLGRREISEMLLQFGASPNTPGIDNRTALHDAAENDKLEEATLLLRFHASRDVYDKYGKRPIDYAVSDAMRTLLADENAVDKVSVEPEFLNATLDQSVLASNAKVVVLPSNLSHQNRKTLTQIASKLKVAVASSFRPGVTHLVVEANERNTTDLTYHVMLAILQGIWILNSQWIAISVDLNDISDIDLELFEVHGTPTSGTPERSRMNEERQNPRLFNNCFFYFTISARGTWTYGNMEFTKANLTALVLAGQGEVLRREPDPEDLKDNKITPFHVAHKPIHPLHRCSHYIIYMPGQDEPRIKYNMPHIKTLPLAWLLECIEKFALVDPIIMGIS